MSLNVSRTTEPLSFNTGIGSASFAEVVKTPLNSEAERALLPGSTSVSQAVEGLFPAGKSVAGEIMSALVAENTARLRTPSGFAQAARDAAQELRATKSEAGEAAAKEIETLLGDMDLFEHYRMALLET